MYYYRADKARERQIRRHNKCTTCGQIGYCRDKCMYFIATMQTASSRFVSMILSRRV